MDVYNDICLSWCSELPTDDSLPSLRESLETLIDPSCQREQYEDIEGFNSYDFPRLSIRQLKDALSMISRRPLVQSGAAESHDAISSALTMITKVLATVVYNAKVSNDYKGMISSYFQFVLPIHVVSSHGHQYPAMKLIQ